MISQVYIIVAVATVAFANLVPIHHAPQPYKFGYTVKDKHSEQHREEVGDGVSGVKGSYGFTDARGIQRQVNYVADHGGFRAQVKTNEPGTANQNPAAVQVISSAPYAGAGLGYSGLGGSSLGLNGVGIGYGGLGYLNGGLGYGYGNLGYASNGLGYGGLGMGGLGYGMGGLGYGMGGLGYGGLRNGGLGYGGLQNGGLGYGNLAGRGLGLGGYGLSSGLLGGLGYSRYGY